MSRYLLQRLAWMLVVLLGVSLITFGLTYLMPGDPARRLAGVNAAPEVVHNIRHQRECGMDVACRLRLRQ